MISLLTTLAITQIIVQYKNVKVGNRISSIESFLQRFGLFNPPLQLREVLAPLRETAKDAKDILIIGRTALHVLRDTKFFKDKIDQGVSIRLAVVNPDNDAVIEAIAQAVEIDVEGLINDMGSAKSLVRCIRLDFGQNCFLSQFQAFLALLIPYIWRKRV